MGVLAQGLGMFICFLHAPQRVFVNQLGPLTTAEVRACRILCCIVKCGVSYHVGWSCQSASPCSWHLTVSTNAPVTRPPSNATHPCQQHNAALLLPLRMLLLTLGVGAMSKAALAL